jgi:hypothetical protein
MKKHTLLALGLLFLQAPAMAQVSDSLLVEKATEKMNQFSKLLQYLAGPELDMASKGEIEQKLEADFMDNQEVRLYQDLNHQFGHAQQIPVNQYFNQLKVLYPNGAELKSGEFLISDIFYNQARDMFYLLFRCTREFKGLNALAKKEVAITKPIEYQVKILEAGKIEIEIVGGHLADGPFNAPIGLDKTMDEIKTKNIAAQAKLNLEDKRIEAAETLLQSLRLKAERYQSLVDVKKKVNEEGSKVKETKSEKKARKAREKLEKARLNRELAKAKEEKRNLFPTRLNIRLGGGYFLTDTALNAMLFANREALTQNWMAKADIVFKVAGVERLSSGKWTKGHGFGIFMNYGKQTGRSLNRVFQPKEGKPPVDTSLGGRGFFELETGFMLREEFRLTGGLGFMNYNQMVDGEKKLGSKLYYSFTTGLSPRLLPFLEMDLNVSWLWFGNQLVPRANVNLVWLIKAKRS